MVPAGSQVLREGIQLKYCLRSKRRLLLLLKKKSLVTDTFFFLLVVVCFVVLHLPVFLNFSLFRQRIILHTAVCSGGSDLLAKTPELTSDMCGVDLTQMTTW